MKTMEITNEIKAKVFGQYLGQRFRLSLCGHNHDVIGIAETITLDGSIDIRTSHNVWHSFDMENDDGDMAFALLRPLSAITDEDAIEVANILLKRDWEVVRYGSHIYYLDVITKCQTWSLNIYWLTHRLMLTRNFPGVDPIVQAPDGIEQAYQYLQSKGYDLPQYLLGGKTLKEAGLATYAHEKS